MLLNDLSSHVEKLRELINTAQSRVLDRSWFVLGPEVAAFEKAFATYVDVAHCRTLANGTDALELGLRALGVQAGDKVATAANAGFYTSTALLAIGAVPLYLDVALESRVLTLSEVRRALKEGVKALVVTHLYGQAAPEIVAIAASCQSAGVVLVEDCAQAHGARVAAKPVGSFGDAGCFSFYPTKNLGALGDGGAVVCKDAALAEKIGALRQYGWSSKYQVELAGARNSRLDEMQAAILSEFLPHLDGWNARRREIATIYTSQIRNPAVFLPRIGAEDYVAHLYVVRTTSRRSLQAHLRALNIASDIHYPIPDYRQPVFGRRFASVSLPHTEQLASEVLTLPCYPEMSDDEVQQVVAAVSSWQA